MGETKFPYRKYSQEPITDILRYFREEPITDILQYLENISKILENISKALRDDTKNGCVAD